MNDNQKAIKAVFGNKARFNIFIKDAKEKLFEWMEEDTTFEDAVEQFCYELNTIMSEHATTTMCGVDLIHYYCRNSDQMQAEDAQSIINGASLIPDQVVNEMFKELENGNISAAYNISLGTYQGLKVAFPQNTMDHWIDYLIKVNEALDGPAEFSNIISDFENCAEKHKLNARLHNTCTSKGTKERPKKI
jgi:hypothetical protein